MSGRRLRNLERLGQLRQSGLLTGIQYEAEKRRLLEDDGRGHRAAMLAIGLLVVVAVAGYLAFKAWPRFRAAAPPTASSTAPVAVVPSKTLATRGAATPPAPALRSLDKVLAFANPHTCAFGKRLDSIFDAMARWSDKANRMVGDETIRIPEIEASIRSSFHRTPHEDGTVEYEASLPIQGTWLGLKVTRLTTAGYEQSDNLAWAIEFDEPPAHVRSALNEHGFRLSP
ncbi:MAG: hypothetical protein QOK17_449 [Sphingomonadales bacterium]|jgi:hypothetical protein|nr:hypothetical protein [Sphingomonadales bacterium]